MPERVVLYALVVGLQPSLVLEIGTFRGGSTLIICAALDDLGKGRLYCVDPAPQIAPEHLEAVSHRATVIAAPSPEALAEARERAGDDFELALIDGDHSFAGVVRDVEGTMEVLADRAHLIFHDAHNREVKRGIDHCLAQHRDELTDCGLLSREVTESEEVIDGERVKWGGLRYVVFERAGQRRALRSSARQPAPPPGPAPLVVRVKHAIKVLLGWA